MALKFGTAVRNARVTAIETVVGDTPWIQIYSGSPPPVEDAPSGVLLAEIYHPGSSWLEAPTAGATQMANLPRSGSAVATGIAGYFRITNYGKVNSPYQGSVSAPAGGGDMIIQNTDIKDGQDVTIVQFIIEDGNA